MNINIMEMNTLIDFHAHILPGMDHGCNDVAMSIRQLNMATDQNIGVVIATSHFYPHQENVEGFLARREEARGELEAVRKNKHPDIRLAAEVLICNNIDKMKGIEKLCLEGSKVMLIEMPYVRQWEAGLIDTVVRLRDKNGLKVILAHGERYPVKEVEKLLKIGFQIQVNVSSIAHIYKWYRIRKWIRHKYVVAFGSDIHGLHNSYKDFNRAMKKLGPLAQQIMEKTRKLVAEQ